ncbi:hypothetical protein GZH46_00081 [Fragariocoptes setiger]|uniref:Uncharacterized protein n=1 Tax=Fragariocoptes setiger TaxID=1670756 RepID=A0ABQ7SD58_9ACAR|nr:hypothetical protein GZH46_00081 [Fragariocoptes setiger]
MPAIRDAAIKDAITIRDEQQRQKNNKRALAIIITIVGLLTIIGAIGLWAIISSIVAVARQ